MVKPAAVGGGVLVAAALGMVAFAVAGGQTKPETAKRQATMSELLTLKSCLAQFRKECGRYPTTAEGLAALYKKPNAPLNGWTGPYVSRLVTTDPWGNRYRYAAKGKGFVLISFGADGAQGGKYADRDLMVQG